MVVCIVIFLIIYGVINMIWCKEYLKSNNEWHDLAGSINSRWADYCRELIDEIIKVKEEVDVLKKTVDEMQEKEE